MVKFVKITFSFFLLRYFYWYLLTYLLFSMGKATKDFMNITHLRLVHFPSLRKYLSSIWMWHSYKIYGSSVLARIRDPTFFKWVVTTCIILGYFTYDSSTLERKCVKNGLLPETIWRKSISQINFKILQCFQYKITRIKFISYSRTTSFGIQKYNIYVQKGMYKDHDFRNVFIFFYNCWK